MPSYGTPTAGVAPTGRTTGRAYCAGAAGAGVAGAGVAGAGAGVVAAGGVAGAGVVAVGGGAELPNHPSA